MFSLLQAAECAAITEGHASVIIKESLGASVSENGEKYVDVEKSYTQITLNIIENDGSIKVLE